MNSDLVRQAQQGDEGAFGSLAIAAGGRLHAVAHRILRDADLAEDATQQALLWIWQDLPSLREPERFEAWAYRLLVRACYREGRKNRVWSPNLRLEPGDGRSVPDPATDIAGRDELERGFRRLSVDHRAVVVLHYYLDMPVEEIATMLRIPTGTVRSRLFHAMRGLRAALQADARALAQELAR